LPVVEDVPKSQDGSTAETAHGLESRKELLAHPEGVLVGEKDIRLERLHGRLEERRAEGHEVGERDREVAPFVRLVADFAEPRKFEDADVTRDAEVSDGLNACGDQDRGIRLKLRDSIGYGKVPPSVTQAQSVVRVEKKARGIAPRPASSTLPVSRP